MPFVPAIKVKSGKILWLRSNPDFEGLSDEERKKFGVILGTGGGSIEFMEKHYEMYKKKNN